MVRDVLAGLSDAQAAVVQDPALPLAVVAGPGAGKTRVLTRRIAWRCRTGDAAPGHTLALTFSRRAAGELRTRLAALGLPGISRDGGVVAGTFHAVAWAQVSRRRAEAGRAPVALLGRPGRLAEAALAEVLGRPPVPGDARAFLAEVAWARRRGATPPTYADVAASAGRWAPWPLEAVGSAWAQYTRAKERRLVIDLDDLLDVAAEMIEADPELAAAVRWRHRHVYVDEYQDLNPAHLRLLRAWAGDGTDVCMVGDPRQAVYGFNGACPDLFGRLGTDWPGVKVVALREDFRSSPELVAFTESLPATLPPATLPSATGPVGALALDGPPGRGAAVARCSTRPPGAVPELAGHPSDDAEAAWVAHAVWACHAAGTGWARMAVLARTNARLRRIAEALAAAGVPSRLRDPRPLSERPAVEEWFAGLAGGTELAQAHVVRDDPDLAALADALDDYRGQVRRATVAGFRAWLDANGPTDEGADGPAVDLATFHRAKGLEWDAVWVAGVEEGTVPLDSAATGTAGLEEECRLLYVALTRAGARLTVSWAGAPSRWVAPLAETAARLSARPPGAEQLRRFTALRGGLAPGATDAGPPARAARRRASLLSWRRARARGAIVAPEVVLPDRVLARLASSDATSVDDVVRAMAGAGRHVHRWAPEIAAVLSAERTA